MESDEVLNLRKVINMQKTQLADIGVYVQNITQLEKQIHTLNEECEQKNVDLRYRNWVIENLEIEVESLRASISAIEANIVSKYESSNSWRITSPFRWVVRIFKQGTEQ